MSELVPAFPASADPLTRLRNLAAQPAARRALPWFGGVAVIGIAALAWSSLAPSPQRVLYSELNDGERAGVVGALDKAGIGYAIDNDTGALTVNESELYRARMLVASDGALATPETGSAMLDSLPMGASRALEGERLRAAREHELGLTIMEIDGVEAVRVHMAEAQRSVFVRDNAPPTASVMLRLARGRQLADSQVSAIVNLVAASVPGLSVDAVRVIDQQGRLLSARNPQDGDRLELQGRMEEKLRGQVATLLTPILGAGNFSTEVQVDLDMDQVTSARESYEKQGVVRSETQAQSTSNGSGGAIGVPGVLSNTPPPATTAQSGAPQGGPASGAATPASNNGESSASRTYELGREVAVANTSPGKLKRLSVAVAISQAALKGGKPTDIDQIKALVSAAVGADPARGDQVAAMIRKFDVAEIAAPAFYEAPWFAMVLRNVVALIALLLVLMMGVRPLLRALRRGPATGGDGTAQASAAPAALTGAIDAALLSRHVGLAQRLAEDKPESAVLALRQMLGQADAGQSA